MSDLISIRATNLTEQLRQKLELEFKFMSEKQMFVEIEEYQEGTFTVFDCNMYSCGNNANYNLFRHYVSDAISDVIVDDLEFFLLEKIIETSYYYFSPNERKKIYELACRSLDPVQNPDALLRKLQKKEVILQSILDYLTSSSKINIEGFLRFRVKEYYDELRDLVEKAVDDLLLEKEYQEFVRLISYFVDVQEPRVDLVHIYMYKDGTFRIEDEYNEQVENKFLDHLSAKKISSETDCEDLLISTLITVAPKWIIFHQGEYQGDIPTVKQIFEKKITFCLGCLRCRDVCQETNKSLKS